MSAEPASPAGLEETLQRGIVFFQNESWTQALACFEKVARARPDSSEVHNRQARALERLGRLDEALQCLDRALALDPGNVADLRNRAVILKKLGRNTEALRACEAALALAPDNTQLLITCGLLLNELNRREEALQSIDRAVGLQPDDLVCLNARVIVLDNFGRYEEALHDLDRMLGIDPHHSDAMNNTGMILARLGLFEKALTCYERSLAIQPNQSQARYNLSLIRLALGDWIRGFEEFECRWNAPPLDKAWLPGLGLLWLGEQDLTRKTLLLYHEQGYGDTLQCVRYVPLLASRGARVVLAVPSELRTLMLSLPGVSQVVTTGDALPGHDFRCPLMSLPWAFRTTPDTVPAPVPYLRADAVAVSRWAERLGPRTRARIGLVWGGRRYAPINYPRDLPLQLLRPLLELEADFIALQKEVAEEDRPLLAQLPLQALGESLEDFADTAALMENLDLIITVDTSVVHLAGALGRPVWLLNRFASCWRWLRERTDSPWYPTLRQFRQPAVGDWTSVVTAVRQAAAAFLASPHTSISPDAGGSHSAQRALERSSAAEVLARSRSAPEKMRFVCATRLSKPEFFATAPLGRSLPLYQTFPRRQAIELRLFPQNQAGLSGLYNIAIEEARTDPAILIFIHDDVYLSDYYWAEHLHEGLRSFDLVGLAGNRRRVPRQASWMYLDDRFVRDNYDNMSGVLGHGDPFPNLRQLSVYGEPGCEVKLLDGVLMAVRSQLLIERDLRFDPRFRFHFYDMDFCRQAELRGVRMGTWALSVVHASAGRLGSDDWRAAYRDYLEKYNEG